MSCACVSIHLALSLQPSKDGRVIHLVSTVDGHYLWVVCLSAGVCSAVIPSLHSLKYISYLIDIYRLAIIAKLWTF